MDMLDFHSGSEEEVTPFGDQLDWDVKRISETCDEWERIMDHTSLPDYAQEEVRRCVGQTRLLMSNKLEQFRELVERCARPDPSRPGLVTSDDLQGFCDIAQLQVKEVDMQFARLTELLASGWAEEPGARPAQPTAVARRPARPAGNSRLRKTNAAAGKAQMQQSEQARSANTPDEEQTKPSSLLSAPVNTFAARCHPRARSPKPRPDAGSATRTGGLRKSALTPVGPMNFDATPGSSILRSDKISPNKSVKIERFKSDNGFESAMGGADIAPKHILVRQDAVEVATTPKVTRRQRRKPQTKQVKIEH